MDDKSHDIESEQTQQLQKGVKEWLQDNRDLYEMPAEQFLYILRKEHLDKQDKKLFRNYLRYLMSQMNFEVDVDEMLKLRKDIKITLLDRVKVVNVSTLFGQNKTYRHVVLMGKVANISTKKRELQEAEGDRIKLSEVTSAIDRICTVQFYKDKLKLKNWPKGLTISDYLLQQPAPTPQNPLEEYEISSVGCHLYNHVLPLQIPSIVMSLPTDIPRPEVAHLLKNSELCTYLNEMHLLAQHIRKNTFFRGSQLHGIHFVDEGEVDCNGRNVARGWLTHGKTKSEGYSWQFDPVFFFKYLARQQNVWKQFVHDMELNGDIPFRIDKILENRLGYQLQSKTNAFQPTSVFEKRETRFPEIRTLPLNKIHQLGKLRHWDGRINDIAEFKEEVLKNRIKEMPKYLSPIEQHWISKGDKAINRQIKQKTHQMAKTRANSLISQRSISQIQTDRVRNKSIEGSQEQLITQAQKQHSSFITNQNDRYMKEAPRMQRRGSVYITSVLQRLSSLADVPSVYDQPQNKKAEYMNMRTKGSHEPLKHERFLKQHMPWKVHRL